MGSVFEFLAEAQAPRKIAVIGTVSDSANPSSRVYPSLARRALAAADEVIFVGSQARHALRLRPESSSLHAFATVPEAQAHLREQLRAGDLVLLKGSGRVDRLRRLVP
jgi:UDP-N-acetylmuramyl pentapeptide synthase